MVSVGLSGKDWFCGRETQALVQFYKARMVFCHVLDRKCHDLLLASQMLFLAVRTKKLQDLVYYSFFPMSEFWTLHEGAEILTVIYMYNLKYR